MSTKIILIIGLIAISILPGCKKETTDNVSKIYKVPTIELLGDAVVSLAVGAPYTDAGAKFHDEDGTTSSITPTTNPVNTAVPGLYQVTFKKKSKSQIYEAEATRIVAVTSVNDPKNYSGNYLRAATGVSAFVQKVANGVYQVTNPGGAAVGVDVVVYFVQTNLTTFVAPTQETTAGPFSVEAITFTATGASWRVVNAGYGTAIRTFVKQ